MLDRTRHVYVTKARDAVVAALEVIIPDDAGGLLEALKESGEVESALGVLSEPHPADGYQWEVCVNSTAETMG